MMCYAEPLHGRTKHILVWENGDFIGDGHTISVNPKHFRTWNGILNIITDVLKPSFGAVRNLVHLDTKEPINSFEKLEINGRYIATGHERLKLSKNAACYKTAIERQKIKNVQPTIVLGCGSTVTSMMRRNKTIIFVMANGKSCEMPCKVVLSESDMLSWDTILNYIAKSLDIPEGIPYLTTVYGERVYDPRELQNGWIYVAVPSNEKFVTLDYVKIFQQLLPMRDKFKIVHNMNARKADISRFDSTFRISSQGVSSMPFPEDAPSQINMAGPSHAALDDRNFIEISKCKSEGTTNVKSCKNKTYCVTRKNSSICKESTANQPAFLYQDTNSQEFIIDLSNAQGVENYSINDNEVRVIRNSENTMKLYSPVANITVVTGNSNYPVQNRSAEALSCAPSCSNSCNKSFSNFCNCLKERGVFPAEFTLISPTSSSCQTDASNGYQIPDRANYRDTGIACSQNYSNNGNKKSVKKILTEKGKTVCCDSLREIFERILAERGASLSKTEDQSVASSKSVCDTQCKGVTNDVITSVVADTRSSDTSINKPSASQDLSSTQSNITPGKDEVVITSQIQVESSKSNMAYSDNRGSESTRGSGFIASRSRSLKKKTDKSKSTTSTQTDMELDHFLNLHSKCFSTTNPEKRQGKKKKGTTDDKPSSKGRPKSPKGKATHQKEHDIEDTGKKIFSSTPPEIQSSAKASSPSRQKCSSKNFRSKSLDNGKKSADLDSGLRKGASSSVRSNDRNQSRTKSPSKADSLHTGASSNEKRSTSGNTRGASPDKRSSSSYSSGAVGSYSKSQGRDKLVQTQLLSLTNLSSQKILSDNNIRNNQVPSCCLNKEDKVKSASPKNSINNSKHSSYAENIKSEKNSMKSSPSVSSNNDIPYYNNPNNPIKENLSSSSRSVDIFKSKNGLLSQISEIDESRDHIPKQFEEKSTSVSYLNLQLSPIGGQSAEVVETSTSKEDIPEKIADKSTSISYANLKFPPDYGSVYFDNDDPKSPKESEMSKADINEKLSPGSMPFDISSLKSVTCCEVLDKPKESEMSFKKVDTSEILTSSCRSMPSNTTPLNMAKCCEVEDCNNSKRISSENNNISKQKIQSATQLQPSQSNQGISSYLVENDDYSFSKDQGQEDKYLSSRRFVRANANKNSTNTEKSNTPSYLTFQSNSTPAKNTIDLHNTDIIELYERLEKYARRDSPVYDSRIPYSDNSNFEVQTMKKLSIKPQKLLKCADKLENIVEEDEFEEPQKLKQTFSKELNYKTKSKTDSFPLIKSLSKLNDIPYYQAAQVYTIETNAYPNKPKKESTDYAGKYPGSSNQSSLNVESEEDDDMASTYSSITDEKIDFGELAKIFGHSSRASGSVNAYLRRKSCPKKTLPVLESDDDGGSLPSRATSIAFADQAMEIPPRRTMLAKLSRESSRSIDENGGSVTDSNRGSSADGRKYRCPKKRLSRDGNKDDLVRKQERQSAISFAKKPTKIPVKEESDESSISTGKPLLPVESLRKSVEVDEALPLRERSSIGVNLNEPSSCLSEIEELIYTMLDLLQKNMKQLEHDPQFRDIIIKFIKNLLAMLEIDFEFLDKLKPDFEAGQFIYGTSNFVEHGPTTLALLKDLFEHGINNEADLIRVKNAMKDYGKRAEKRKSGQAFAQLLGDIFQLAEENQFTVSDDNSERQDDDVSYISMASQADMLTHRTVRQSIGTFLSEYILENQDDIEFSMWRYLPRAFYEYILGEILPQLNPQLANLIDKLKYQILHNIEAYYSNNSDDKCKIRDYMNDPKSRIQDVLQTFIRNFIIRTLETHRLLDRVVNVGKIIDEHVVEDNEKLEPCLADLVNHVLDGIMHSKNALANVAPNLCDEVMADFMQHCVEELDLEINMENARTRDSSDEIEDEFILILDDLYSMIEVDEYYIENVLMDFLGDLISEIRFTKLNPEYAQFFNSIFDDLLSGLNRNALLSSPDGRKQIKEFVDDVIQTAAKIVNTIKIEGNTGDIDFLPPCSQKSDDTWMYEFHEEEDEFPIVVSGMSDNYNAISEGSLEEFTDLEEVTSEIPEETSSGQVDEFRQQASTKEIFKNDRTMLISSNQLRSKSSNSGAGLDKSASNEMTPRSSYKDTTHQCAGSNKCCKCVGPDEGSNSSFNSTNAIPRSKKFSHSQEESETIISTTNSYSEEKLIYESQTDFRLEDRFTNTDPKSVETVPCGPSGLMIASRSTNFDKPELKTAGVDSNFLSKSKNSAHMMSRFMESKSENIIPFEHVSSKTCPGKIKNNNAQSKSSTEPKTPHLSIKGKCNFCPESQRCKNCARSVSNSAFKKNNQIHAVTEVRDNIGNVIQNQNSRSLKHEENGLLNSREGAELNFSNHEFDMAVKLPQECAIALQVANSKDKQYLSDGELSSDLGQEYDEFEEIVIQIKQGKNARKPNISSVGCESDEDVGDCKIIKEAVCAVLKEMCDLSECHGNPCVINVKDLKYQTIRRIMKNDDHDTSEN